MTVRHGRSKRELYKYSLGFASEGFYDLQNQDAGDYCASFFRNSRTSTASMPADRIACKPRSVSS